MLNWLRSKMQQRREEQERAKQQEEGKQQEAARELQTFVQSPDFEKAGRGLEAAQERKKSKGQRREQ